MLFSFLLFRGASFVTNLVVAAGVVKSYKYNMRDVPICRMIESGCRCQIGSVRLLVRLTFSSYNQQMFYCFLLSN